MVFLPVAAEANSVLKVMQREVSQNPAFYYAEEDLTAAQALENKAIALASVQELIAELKNPDVQIEQVREKILRQLLAEEEIQLIELEFLLERMPVESMDTVFGEAFKTGKYHPDLRLQYDLAYSAAEKRHILLELVRGDLSQVKSVTMKRLGLLDREGLIQELNLTRSLMNTKARDTWRVVLVIVLSVAVAGFVGWAAVSSAKKHWQRKTEKLEKDHKQREEDLRSEYANKEEQLQAAFEERSSLREEGFVWAVCGTTERAKSVSCSYDFSSHAGTEVCVTRCMKNMTTGQEKLPQTSCTSSFIPSNCTLTNPYASGYDSGYGSGYDKSYETAYDKAYYDAYSDFYDRGYETGYIKGYDEGYNDGFTDGLAQAEYDERKWAEEAAAEAATEAANDIVEIGYKTGYKEGYAAAGVLQLGD
ncbi:MAG: hypothetical protein A2X94_07740 [Bdellovibrionales bacterium GWB1_55_8]|nr:MAG: hypothetical protein A2X94_07740 [Bdellovibrionales bacterium GWB1_55_8]